MAFVGWRRALFAVVLHTASTQPWPGRRLSVASLGQRPCRKLAGGCGGTAARAYVSPPPPQPFVEVFTFNNDDALAGGAEQQHTRRPDSVLATAAYLFGPGGFRKVHALSVGTFATIRLNSMPNEYRDELQSSAEQTRHLRNNSLPAAPERYVFRLHSFNHVDVTCPSPPAGIPRTCAATNAVLTRRRSANCTPGRPSVAGDAFWFAYAPTTMTQFHHFMTEWLPNLAFLLATVPVERLAQRATVLIVDEWALKSSVIREALIALAIPSTALQAVPAAGLCVGSSLLYPEKLAYLYGAVSHPAVQTLRLLRANVLSAAASLSAAAAGVPAGTGPHESSGPELVFIDRLDAPRVASKRVLTNAAVLGAGLQRRGFAQLSLATLSFSAPARKLSNAKVVVMLAGTTQVNSLFVPPGTRIIVVGHPFGFSNKWNCVWFSWLCSLSGCDMILLNNTLPDDRRAAEPWRNDYKADLQPLLAELDALMRTLAGGPDRWPPTGQGVHCQHSCDIDVWDRHAIGLAGVVRDPLIRTCAVRCGRRPSMETKKHAAAAEP